MRILHYFNRMSQVSALILKSVILLLFLVLIFQLDKTIVHKIYAMLIIKFNIIINTNPTFI